jgi:predicted DNA-binding protein (MmcQ/YjbR family)
MNNEEIRDYCLEKPGVTECYPFDEFTMVMKVMSKMFIYVSLDRVPSTMNLKCDPEKAMELREKYDSVTPGFHANKKYWNTIILDNTIPDKFIRQWIDDSYSLVSAGLKKKEKEELSMMAEKAKKVL